MNRRRRKKKGSGNSGDKPAQDLPREKSSPKIAAAAEKEKPKQKPYDFRNSGKKAGDSHTIQPRGAEPITAPSPTADSSDPKPEAEEISAAEETAPKPIAEISSEPTEPPTESAPQNVEEQQKPELSEPEPPLESTLEDETEPSQPWYRSLVGGLSPLEKAACITFAVLLLSGAVWGLVSANKITPEQEKAERVRFPFSGKSYEIASVETFWRAPRLEGEQQDLGVPKDISLLPAASITLAEGSLGQLRFLFKDERGSVIGDATTVSYAGGVFQSTRNRSSSFKKTEKQNDTVEIYATNGLLTEGEMVPYVSNEDLRWSLSVLHSPNGRDFAEVFSLPIAAYIQDSK